MNPLKLSCACLLLLATAAAQSLVNFTGTSQTATVGSVSLPAINVGAGNLLVLGVRVNTGAGINVSVSDTAANTFTEVPCSPINTAAFNSQLHQYYVKSAIANASDVITVTLNPADNFSGYEVEQWSGLSDFDGCESATAATTSVSTISFSPFANGVNIAFAGIGGTSGITWTAGTGYTVRDTRSYVGMEDFLNTGTSAQQAAITSSGTPGDTTIIVSTFLPSKRTLTPVPLIWDSGMASDPGDLVYLGSINKMADRGEFIPLAVISDTKNDRAPDAIYAVMKYYGRPNVPIGANQAGAQIDICGNTIDCNDSSYTPTISASFGKNLTRFSYPDCVTTLRTVLSAAITKYGSGNVVYGFGGPNASCIMGLLNSPADGISPLTGAQLAKQTRALYVPSGKFPSGLEFNMEADPVNYNALVTTWTTQNGYPPIWFSGFDNGDSIGTGPPAYGLDTVSPVLKGFELASEAQSRAWSDMVLLLSSRGFRYQGPTMFLDNGNGTVSVDSSTGASSWASSPASGHHYITKLAPDSYFGSLVDGFAHPNGFAALPPYVSTGGMNRQGTVKKGVTLR